MTGTVLVYLACGGPGHHVSVGLRAVEVVGVLLPLAGAVLLIIGLGQRFAAAKRPPAPPPPGYPQQWSGGYPPGPPPGRKPRGTTFIRVGLAMVALGLLCFAFLWSLAC